MENQLKTNKMKKLILMMFIVASTISCTTESSTEQGTLNFPQRYVGEYIAVQSGRHATITLHSITIETDGGTVRRTNGTTTYDTEVLFKTTLNEGEELILLSGNGFIGITMYSDGSTVNSEYYVKQ